MSSNSIVIILNYTVSKLARFSETVYNVLSSKKPLMHCGLFIHIDSLSSVVVSALALINVVNRHWARLVLGWVTVCGRVNHLGM